MIVIKENGIADLSIWLQARNITHDAFMSMPLVEQASLLSAFHEDGIKFYFKGSLSRPFL